MGAGPQTFKSNPPSIFSRRKFVNDAPPTLGRITRASPQHGAEPVSRSRNLKWEERVFGCFPN